ncbi:MAG: putative LytR family regulatory protein [Ilumatobacteraceae bacterium]|nr:putative LytR family regulatory protein [Ilumatobacteraceae bacterium]
MQIEPSAIEPDPAGEVVRPSGLARDQGEPGRRRRRPQRGLSFLVLAVVIAAAGAAGVIRTANQQVARIARVDGLAGVLSPSNPNVENFLLVGSDSRAGEDPTDPDFGAIGTDTTVTGNRSDTIMVLRRDLHGGPASLLSLPRDLWVDIPGHTKKNRINSAYQDGPAVLIQTVQGLGIPIQHYVEINFQGFKALVDAIGGVRVCAYTPIRDTHTGLYVAQPGCHILDGVQGLAYARSRHFETYDQATDTWTEDPTSDLGRIKRQQQFINTALQGAIAKVKGDPLKAGDVLVSSTGALKIDSGLDVLGAAGALRDAVGSGVAPFSPPVVGKKINGNAVLLFGDGAQAYIDYFAGVSSTPPTPA